MKQAKLLNYTKNCFIMEWNFSSIFVFDLLNYAIALKIMKKKKNYNTFNTRAKLNDTHTHTHTHTLYLPVH